MTACLLFLQVSYPLHDTDDETVKVSRVCMPASSLGSCLGHRMSDLEAKHGSVDKVDSSHS